MLDPLHIIELFLTVFLPNTCYQVLKMAAVIFSYMENTKFWYYSETCLKRPLKNRQRS